MQVVHTATQGRIGEIVELVRAVSAMHDPQQVQVEFGRRMGRFTHSDAYLALSTRGLPQGRYKVTRRILSRQDLHRPAVNPWTQWADIPDYAGGFLGEVIATPTPKLLHNLRIVDDPALGDSLADMGSAIAVPLFDDGEALNWAINFRAQPDGFTEDDLESFLLRANLVGRITKTLVVRGEVERLNKRLNTQLERVASIQRALLPDRTPDIPGLEIATSYLTSDEAGGDHFDFIPLPDGRWGIFVGDVSGHGAGAATVVAMLHAILRTYPAADHDPGRVLTYLNAHLSEKRIESNFVTAFYAVYDPETRSVEFANAGHHPPRRKLGDSGEVVELDGVSSIPLGIISDIPFETNRARLETLDTLVLFTDGVTEAKRDDGEMFGVERLDAALRVCSGEPPCVIDSVHAALYEHTRARTRDDDQTLVALRVGPDAQTKGLA